MTLPHVHPAFRACVTYCVTLFETPRGATQVEWRERPDMSAEEAGGQP